MNTWWMQDEEPLRSIHLTSLWLNSARLPVTHTCLFVFALFCWVVLSPSLMLFSWIILSLCRNVIKYHFLSNVLWVLLSSTSVFLTLTAKAPLRVSTPPLHPKLLFLCVCRSADVHVFVSASKQSEVERMADQSWIDPFPQHSPDDHFINDISNVPIKVWLSSVCLKMTSLSFRASVRNQDNNTQAATGPHASVSHHINGDSFSDSVC